MELKKPEEDCFSQEQRSFWGTPARACSMWLPQPVQVALPQVRHVVFEHMGFPFVQVCRSVMNIPRGVSDRNEESANRNVIYDERRAGRATNAHRPDAFALAIRTHKRSLRWLVSRDQIAP